MKKFAKIIALVMVAVLALSFGACESNADKMAALVGTYHEVYTYPEEDVKELLTDYLEAYDAEIALADLTSYKEVYVAKFDADGNYYLNIDADATIDYVEDFYDGYFTALYEGRTTLNDAYSAYGITFDEMTEDEFKQFFAEMYSQEDYAALIEYLVDADYYYGLEEEYEDAGTYTIRNGKIYCKENGASEEETLGYNLEGDTLTLYFSDSTDIYTKVN